MTWSRDFKMRIITKLTRSENWAHSLLSTTLVQVSPLRMARPSCSNERSLEWGRGWLPEFAKFLTKTREKITRTWAAILPWESSELMRNSLALKCGCDRHLILAVINKEMKNLRDKEEFTREYFCLLRYTHQNRQKIDYLAPRSPRAQNSEPSEIIGKFIVKFALCSWRNKNYLRSTIPYKYPQEWCEFRRRSSPHHQGKRVFDVASFFFAIQVNSDDKMIIIARPAIDGGTWCLSFRSQKLIDNLLKVHYTQKYIKNSNSNLGEVRWFGDD